MSTKTPVRDEPMTMIQTSLEKFTERYGRQHELMAQHDSSMTVIEAKDYGTDEDGDLSELSF